MNLDLLSIDRQWRGRWPLSQSLRATAPIPTSEAADRSPKTPIFLKGKSATRKQYFKEWPIKAAYLRHSGTLCRYGLLPNRIQRISMTTTPIEPILRSKPYSPIRLFKRTRSTTTTFSFSSSIQMRTWRKKGCEVSQELIRIDWQRLQEGPQEKQISLSLTWARLQNALEVERPGRSQGWHPKYWDQGNNTEVQRSTVLRQSFSRKSLSESTMRCKLSSTPWMRRILLSSTLNSTDLECPPPLTLFKRLTFECTPNTPSNTLHTHGPGINPPWIDKTCRKMQENSFTNQLIFKWSTLKKI